jgi:uncharacterized RmlC-like cupin family protein
LIRPRERTEGQLTEGMLREEAVAIAGLWAGVLRTSPGTVSGWHHHGEHESVIYVVDGALRMEFGTGGRDVLEAGPGDFLHVGKGAIHRESNPTEREATAVVVRAGKGEVVVNVDGPEEPER